MRGRNLPLKYKQPEGWDFGLLPGELTGTSAGIGRCQLHLVGVGIRFSKSGVEVRPPQLTLLPPLFPPCSKFFLSSPLVRVPCHRWFVGRGRQSQFEPAFSGDNRLRIRSEEHRYWLFHIKGDSKAIIPDSNPSAESSEYPSRLTTDLYEPPTRRH
jgi:hypothetical protein